MESAATMFTQAAHFILVWVGFGTLVGLLAKAILPGKDPGGTFATVTIGIVGSIIGAGVLLFFSSDLRITPISPIGFVVALGGTSLLLVMYRLLAGKTFGMPWRGRRGGHGGHGGRRISVVVDPSRDE